jgi:hypothetical protein
MLQESMEEWLDLVNDALSDLTAVAPYIESAIEGEHKFEHGHHYADHYQRLLDHPRYGLATILCELTRIRQLMNGSSGVKPTSATSLPNNMLVANNAIRHYRDYVVLRDLRKLLHRFRSDLRHSLR